MMLRSELQKYSRSLGFNLGQTEIDYLQHLFLSILSHHASEHLIFKGGTALQKAYGLRRFSIDLDFTATNKTGSMELMKTISKEIEHFGYPTKVEEVETLGETFIFRISGPLSGAGPISIASLRIEISQRESLLLEPLKKEVNPGYPDLKHYKVFVMAEKEIFAEKIRALLTRFKARDLFDLYFLINREIWASRELIQTKMNYYQEVFSLPKILERIKVFEPIWSKEMLGLTKDSLSFEVVSALVKQKMREKYL